MYTAHNMLSENCGRLYNINNTSLNKTLEKLSSGYKINRSADNAAGLAISEKMRSQIGGTSQAAKNCQDGISLIQTMEGALEESQRIIARCHQLALQAANGTYENDVDREAIQLEIDQMKEELDQIADTDFNGVRMLDGKGVTAEKVTVPYSVVDNSPIFDENGNPVIDNSSFRCSAAFSDGPPFGENDVAAPNFIRNSEQIFSTYNTGSTSENALVITGSITTPDGIVNAALSEDGYPNHHNDMTVIPNFVRSSGITESFTDSNGNTGYTNTVTYTSDISEKTGVEGDKAVFSVKQIAEPELRYLTDSNGQILSDSEGPVITDRLWKISYEISAAPDSSANFRFGKADYYTFTDTVFSNSGYGDSDERYYTPDDSSGPMTISKEYTAPNMINRFSSYYYNTEASNFNDISQMILIDTSTKGPDKLILGSYGYGFDIPAGDHLSLGSDLAYVTEYNNRTPDPDGTVRLNGGSRGVSNTNSNTLISPKLKTEYREEYRLGPGKSELLLQAGAGTKDIVDFTFDYTSKGIGKLISDLNCTAAGLGVDKLSLLTQESANEAIDKLLCSQNKLSMIRSSFGAVQNRLEHKIDDLNNTNENISSAESKLRDADVADEISIFTKDQILVQSSQAMLAQANSLPQSVLQLL